MNKENEFNLNLSYNSQEKVPIISISNKSKSNSSNNPNNNKFPKKFPKKLHNLDNSQNSYSFSIRHKRLKNSGNTKEQNSLSIFTYTQNSMIQLNDKSKESKEKFGENKLITETKNEKLNLGNETPRKKSNKNLVLFENFKNKKKDVLNVDNVHGKNLMEYFEKMAENIGLEENNKNRVSSVGNKVKNSIKLKNTNVNTNKSWNKNKLGLLFSKVPLKINNKNKNISYNNTAFFPLKKKNLSESRYASNIKNLQNLLLQNNINIDLKNLIDKYRPNRLKKKEKNNNSSIGKANTDKKLRYKKIEKTPNSDYHNRKFSFSHLKNPETAIKNLFHDYNKKISEFTKVNKYININEKKPSDKRFEKNIIFHPQLKNKNNNKLFPLNKNNIMKNKNIQKQNENKNNIQKINNYYLKYKEIMEIGKNKKSGN